MPVILPESGTFDLDEFEPYILPAAQSAPIDAVERAVKQAAVEFCRRTLIWHEPLPDLDTVADQEAYLLDRPDDSTVFKLLSASLAGRELAVVTYAAGLVARRNPYNLATADNAYLDAINQIHLAPAPTVAGQVIAVEAVLVPTLEAATLPGLLQPHLEDIAFGALKRLMLIKESDAYDPNLAAINARMFDDRIQATSVRVNRGMSGAKIRGQRDPAAKFF